MTGKGGGGGNGMAEERGGGAFAARWPAEAARLAARGLYDPAAERDSCGVGFVAAIDGVARREVSRPGSRR